MRGSILKKSLSTILTASLFVQLSLGTSLALGQSTTNPLAPNDPFWSNTSINPTQSSFWFNSSTDPVNPGGNDPWGNWSDNGSGWGGGTSNNGWDQSFNSGVSDYSGLGSFGYGYGNVRPTDPFWLQLMRMSGVVDKNYTKTVNSLRTKYGAYGSEDNDALADKVINHSSLVAGGLAGAAAVMTRTMQYVGANQSAAGGMGMGYYYAGMVSGYLADFMTVILEEANMIYSLQEIYGELSPDPDERANSAVWPFILGMSGTALNKYVADQLLITPPPSPNPDPNPIPDPVPPDPLTTTTLTTDTAKTAAVEDAQKTAAMAANDAKFAVESVRTPEARKGITARFMKFFKKKKMSRAALEKETDNLLIRSKAPQFMAYHFPKIFAKFKDPATQWLQTMRSWPVVSRVATAALVSTGFNAANCLMFGHWAKAIYKAQHKIDLARSLELMRATPKAVAVVWLVLLRDVFQEFEEKDGNGRNHHNDARMYAAIMNEKIPLWRYDNDRGYRDDLMTILTDYKNNPKMIDDYLADLQTELSIDGKLEIIKDIYAGMLMKGMPSNKDLTTIGNVAAGLGLRPPVYVKVASLDQMLENPSPTNLKADHLLRYLNLIHYLDLVAQDRAQDKVAPGTVKAKRWRIGQLIWEESHDTDVQIGAKILDDVQKNGGIQKQDIANAQALGQKITQGMQSPPTNVVNNDDLFKEFGKNNGSFSPGQQQQPVQQAPPATSTNTGTGTNTSTSTNTTGTSTVPPDPFAVPSVPVTPQATGTANQPAISTTTTTPTTQPPATSTTSPMAPASGPHFTSSTTSITPVTAAGTTAAGQIKTPPVKSQTPAAPVPPVPTSNPNT